VLRPEHGIAFEKVGLLDNDMTIWHQTFIIPIPRAEIPITRSAMLESSRKKNDVSEFDRIAHSLMNDYSRKIKELKAVLENTQHYYYAPTMLLAYRVPSQKILLTGLLRNMSRQSRNVLHRPPRGKSAHGYLSLEMWPKQCLV
jgi:hypothetical protein